MLELPVVLDFVHAAIHPKAGIEKMKKSEKGIDAENPLWFSPIFKI